MAPPSDPPKRYEQLSPWILKRRKLAWKDGRWIGANGFKDRLVAQKREDWDEQELRECINFILVTKEIDPANPPPEIVAIQQKQISQPDTQNIPTGPRADRQRASSSVAPSSSAGARSDFGGDNDSVTTSKHAGSSQPALSGRKARRAAQANGGTQSLAGEQSGPDPRPEWDDAGSPALDWATLNGNSIANDANGLAQLAGGNLGGGFGAIQEARIGQPRTRLMLERILGRKGESRPLLHGRKQQCLPLPHGDKKTTPPPVTPGLCQTMTAGPPASLAMLQAAAIG
ncbi:hypothetical protein BDZ91DRAFT_458897 [Kalaharituber pfeilii]|nr:hypothetical protein BDZ91DRAFT_458897 [Kalaharituber pfeilii]